MSSHRVNNQHGRTFGLKRCFTVAACTLVIAASAAPSATAANTIASLTKNCVKSTVVNHDNWAEVICDLPANHNLEKRASTHFYSFRDGDSYVSVGESGTLSRNIVLWGSWKSIVDQPKRCTSDGRFCFDIWNNVCQYFLDSSAMERYCNNYSAVDAWI
ncbi:hypothetical protein BGZ73_005460 [Actinomortierella ambigua]|nr:hypothetical protein BGZ73_005460 [Actinomortierella ambigua]